MTKPKKEKTKAKKQEIEVLNAGASSSAGAGPSSSTADADSSDDEEGVPELSATLEAFSKLPLRGYEKSWEFIQNHRDVFVPGASDALLVAGFRARKEILELPARCAVPAAAATTPTEEQGKDAECGADEVLAG